MCLFALEGNFDAQGAPEFEEAFKTTPVEDRRIVLLDCAEVQYISSAGLRAIIRAFQETQQAEGKFALCSLKSEVAHVLELAGGVVVRDRNRFHRQTRI